MDDPDRYELELRRTTRRNARIAAVLMTLGFLLVLALEVVGAYGRHRGLR
jgi:hypothetical protein